MPKPKVPVINWNNPLTRGLFIDLPMFEGGGTTPLDIARKIIGSFSNGTPSWINGLLGQSLKFRGGANTDTVSLTVATYPTVRTVESLFLINSIDATARRLYDNGVTGGLIFFNNTTIIGFQQTWSVATGDWHAAASPIVGAYNHLVVTYDGSSTSNNPIFYLNGVSIPVTVNVAPSGTVTNSPGTVPIGNRTGGDRCFDGNISYLRYWNRILSPSEVKQLYTNPWGIYNQSGIIQVFNSFATTIVSTLGWRNLLGVGR